ncbi:MAG: hypothetical protein WCG07_02105 [Candidatus Taylorbacteria bacterium]
MKNSNEMGMFEATMPILLGGLVLTGVMIYESDPKHRVKADGEYNVIDARGGTVILEKDGKRYTTEIENLSPAFREKLAEIRPDLKGFLDNGPINIVK